MSGLVELVSVHGHRIYLNTDCIRRIEPRNDQPPTTLIVYSYQNGETGFEVPGKRNSKPEARPKSRAFSLFYAGQNSSKAACTRRPINKPPTLVFCLPQHAVKSYNRPFPKKTIRTR